MNLLGLKRFVVEVPGSWRDEAEHRRAQVLHATHLFVFFGGFLYLFAPSWLLNGQPVYVVATLVISVIGSILLRSGSLKWSGIWTIGTMWLIFTVGSTTEGGITSSSFAGTIAMVVFAGLTYGLTGTILISGMSILAGAGLLYLKAYHILPPPAIVYDDLNILSDFTVYIVITTMFTTVAIRRIERSTARFEAELAERKRVETALRESDARWQFALEGAGEGVWDWNVESNEVFFSARWKAMLGYTDAELQNNVETWESRIHPEDKARVFGILQKHLDGESPSYESEHRLRCKDGSYKWILGRGKIISRNADGKPLRILGTHSDISERKLAESSTLYLAQALQSITEIVTITDFENKLTFVNQAFLNTYGYTREEVIGRHISIVWSPNNPPGLLEEILEKHRGIRWSGEIVNVTKGGREFTLALRTSQVRDAAGSIVGYVGISEDITEYKLAQEALKKSEEKFSKSFEANPACLVISRIRDGLIIDVNRGFELLTSYSRSEAVGRSVFELKLWRDERRREELFPRLFTEGKISDVEVEFTSKEGRIIPCLYSVEKIVLGDEPCAIAAVTDLSDRRRLEQRLLQAQKLESIGTLAAGIAHDFNNILNIIVGNADLLAKKPGDQERTSRRLGAITTAAGRAAQMVRQLLTFARKTQVNRQRVAMNDVISETVKLIGETFPKTIVIALDLAGELPPVTADPQQIQQVMLNLCVNARDAMPDGGTLGFCSSLVPGVSVRKKFPDASAAEYVGMIVRDTGCGMDARTREHLFDPFFTTKDPGKGTGLGMAVVQGIVQGHEGFIDVVSAPGQGTSIEIYFPASEERDVEMSGTSGSEIVDGGKETVLFVEDEELTREIAAECLTARGYRVLLACDGKEGVELFRMHATEIDIVVSDFGLPVFSGEQVYDRIATVDADKPFVLISGFVDPEKERELMAKGVCTILPKPFKPDALLQAVRSALDRRS
ncbi:MAG TPA: PAS domain S-box protein [Bacteroidota bacterium]|nr:PAS domain S-box protein [Bacteroidota bacterium]